MNPTPCLYKNLNLIKYKYIFLENRSSPLNGVYLVGHSEETPSDQLKIIRFDFQTNSESDIGLIPYRQGAPLASLQGEFSHSYVDVSIGWKSWNVSWKNLPLFPFVDSLFLIGGEIGTPGSTQVSAFDVVAKSLQIIPDMFESRHSCAVASSTREILVCGGDGSGERCLSSCELFQLAQKR